MNTDSPLRAFVVSADHSDGSVIVFAKKRSRAKSLASKADCFCDFEFTELRCRREPDIDKYAEKFGEVAITGYSRNEQELMRDLGWFELDGGGCCDECGMHEWSGIPESMLEEVKDEGEICAECRAEK